MLKAVAHTTLMEVHFQTQNRFTPWIAPWHTAHPQTTATQTRPQCAPLLHLR